MANDNIVIKEEIYMSDNRLKCKVTYYERRTLFMKAILDVDIERKNAEDIAQKFKGDKYISANIVDNILEVYVTSPRFSRECTRLSGESIIRHF